MRSGSLCLLLCALLGNILWPWSSASAQEDSSRSSISYHASRAFFIPFDLGRSNIRRLILYASEDGGPWRRVSESSPDQRGFDFQTDRDGTYTFAVQVIYTDGTEEPAQLEQLRSHLRVVVDTQAPIIDARFVKGDPGTAGIAWDARDRHLDPSSIRLEGRWPGQQEWVPIRGTFNARDQYLMVLQPGQRYQVRVRASDRSRNTGTSDVVVVSLDGTSTGVERPSAPRNPTATPGDDLRPTSGERAISYINSKQVNLETNIEVGKSGLSEIQLWVTRDRGPWEQVRDLPPLNGGKTGTPAPEAVGSGDQTKLDTHTLPFTAPADGLYGFRVIPRSGVGLGPPPPRRDDPPQILVYVDTVKPKIDLKDVRVLPNGDQGNLLQLTWDASDEHLDRQPIDIQYTTADRPTDEDWKMLIQESLDNTGRYTWAVPSNHPYRFRLRVRAVDKAGNLSVSEWPDEVVVDLFVPKADIIHVTAPKRPPR